MIKRIMKITGVDDYQNNGIHNDINQNEIFQDTKESKKNLTTMKTQQNLKSD